MLLRSRTRRNVFDCALAAVGLAVLLAVSLAAMPAGAATAVAAAPPEVAASPAAPGDVPPAAGGSLLLDRLWTPDQLRVDKADAATGRVRPPDHSGPDPLPEGAAAAETTDLTAPLPPAGSIRRVKPRGNDRPVALTFDLCERADQRSAYDGAIVDKLRRERAPATFFAGGKWMRTHPERTMQLMADPLFEVGNHAWTHGNLRVLGGERAEQQIAGPQQEFAALRARLAERATAAGVPPATLAAVPVSPTVFRFPYGVCSKESLATARRLGLASIQWDVISGDVMRGMTAERIRHTVLGEVKPGSIVVFHANGRGQGTAGAIAAVVEGLRAKGFRLVTVSELLRAGDPVATDDCYELRPGDNGRYDKAFGEGTG